MLPPRRHIRRRLALEFVLIAGAIHLVLIVLILGLREGHLRQQFDGDLLRRAERIAGAAAQDLVPPTAVVTAATADLVASGTLPLIARSWDMSGNVLASSPEAPAESLTLPFSPTPTTRHAGPFYATLDGAAFGSQGEQYRVVTLFEDGPPPYYLQIAASMEPVLAAIASFRRLLFLYALPGTLLGTIVASWLVSGHVVRRMDEAAEEARRSTRMQPQSRLDVASGSDDVGGMVVEMNGMLSRLENAFRAQERFIVDVTHELKTPVSVMLAEAQVLKKSKSAGPERYQEFVSSVEEEMRRLGSLLESFLTLARSGHGARYVSESLVDLSDVVLEAIQRCDSAARNRQVRLTLLLPTDEADQESIVIRGDHELLTTLVTNLVRNAVDYSSSESGVEVAIAIQNEQASVRITHHDSNGQNAAPARRRELAFNVARGIAELHGGEIQTSRHGDQEESSVLLPIVRAA